MKTGVSFRLGLLSWIDARPLSLECLEIDGEYFGKQFAGAFLRKLSDICPLIVRAHGLSLGIATPLGRFGLERLARFAAEAEPLWVVQRLAFSRTREIDLGAPVPVPPSPNMLGLVADQAQEILEACQRPLVLEGVASCLDMRGDLGSTEFLNRLSERSGCGLGLDLGAVLSNSRRHGFEAGAWLRDIDPHRIAQIRVAGMSGARGGGDGREGGLLDSALRRLTEQVLAYAPANAVIVDEDIDFRHAGEIEARLRALKSARRAASVTTGGTAAEPIRRPLSGGGSRPLAAAAAADPPRLDRAYRSGHRAPGPGSVRPAEGTALFVLDDAGIFFAASRNEIYAFNRAASFIWCCLEEGRSIREIVECFTQASGVPPDTAEKTVTDLLHRWQGLGYIDGFVHPPDSELDMATALGRLLTNPSLREAFSTSPLDAAHRMGIRSGDLAAFLRLDPQQLAREAERLVESGAARKTRADHRGPGAASVLPPELRRDRPSVWFAERDYRVLTTRFRLRFGTRPVEGAIAPALAQLECAPTPAADVTLEVWPCDGGYLMETDFGGNPRKCSRLEQVTPIVKSTVRAIAIDRYEFLVEVHAGVVSNGRACVLLPAPSGAGKTTLTAALAGSGFEYFSDEVALLTEGDLRCPPLPLSLAVKAGSVEPLLHYFPRLPSLPVHRREDERGVRYLRPFAATDGATADRSLPVASIVFPRFQAGRKTALEPVPRADALARLLEECTTLPRRLDAEDVARLVRWIRKIDCHELAFSSLPDAVRLVRGTLD